MCGESGVKREGGGGEVANVDKYYAIVGKPFV